jgi:hypothetical protein
MPEPYSKEVGAFLAALEAAQRSPSRRVTGRRVRDFSQTIGWLPAESISVPSGKESVSISRQDAARSLERNSGEPFEVFEYLGRLWDGRGTVGMDRLRFKKRGDELVVQFGPYVLNFTVENERVVLKRLGGGWRDEGD